MVSPDPDGSYVHKDMLIQKFLAGIANMAAFSREAEKKSLFRDVKFSSFSPSFYVE